MNDDIAWQRQLMIMNDGKECQWWMMVKHDNDEWCLWMSMMNDVYECQWWMMLINNEWQ